MNVVIWKTRNNLCFQGLCWAGDGEAAWQLCKIGQELANTERAGGYRKAGNVGARPGEKKRKAASPEGRKKRATRRAAAEVQRFNNEL
jgi:hypothetical protein